MAEVIMPKMGDQMTEGKVVAWRKQQGDAVQRGEAIAEIETEKTNVEIEAEEGGTLAEILVKEGETAPVGATIARINGAATGGRAAPPPAAEGQRPASPSAPSPSREEGARRPAGDGTPSRETAPPSRAIAAPPPAGRPTERRVAEAPAGSPAPSGPAPAAAPAKGQRIKASPLARRLAAEHGVDLALVKGTGPGGRIEKRDIEQFRQAPPEPAPAAVARPAAPAPPPEVAYEDRELSRMRQAIARNMTISKPGAPHIYLTLDVEMDAALALRSQLNGLVGDDERARLSVNDLVLKAAALGLRKCPDLNAWFLDETPPKVRLFRQVNLGIAVPTDEGLFAPVLRDVASKTLGQIATETKGIYDRVRANKPRPDEFVGGTFTVSNLGMLGIDEFQAVLVPPQVGILAVGAATPKAVVRDGQVEVRTIMRVTLSSDHRAVDGVYSARYLQELKRLLEAPLGLVL